MCMRARSPVPRALEFKLTLRLIMLSQFFRPSHQIDDSVDLLEFLEVKKAASQKSLEAGEEVLFEDSFLDDEAPPLDDVEMESFVYLSSYITCSVSKRYTLCNACKVLKDEPIEELDELLQSKSYWAHSLPNPLVHPSAHVMSLLKNADSVFPSCEHDVLNVSLPALTKATLDSYHLPNNFPNATT